MKEKLGKENFGGMRKLLETELFCRNLIKRNKQLGSPTFKIVGTILQIDKGISQTNGLEDKSQALHLQDSIDISYVSSKEGGKELKIALMNQYKDEDYIEKRNERLISTTSNNNEKQGSRNGKKSNCMDSSSDNRVRLPTRKPVHG